MKKYVKFTIWPLLYAAFFIVAIGVKQKVSEEGLSEIWGWDYRTFVDQIQTWGYITYFGFRHPGLGMILSPLVALEHLWSSAYLVVMPGVALLTAALIKKMAGWLGFAVWLSFPTTWLMAATPESFPIAQLALVTGACFGRVDRESGRRLFGAIGWSVLNGLITLTNGVKPMLAYLVTCRDWKVVRRVVGLGFAAVVLGATFFYARSLVSGRSCLAGLEMTLSWIPETRNLPRELYDFFVRPVGFYQSFAVYPLVFFGVFRALSTKHYALTAVCAAYFSVDFVLHLVIGWGAAELWVFAPHWIWILPLLAGRVRCTR